VLSYQPVNHKYAVFTFKLYYLSVVHCFEVAGDNKSAEQISTADVLYNVKHGTTWKDMLCMV